MSKLVVFLVYTWSNKALTLNMEAPTDAETLQPLPRKTNKPVADSMAQYRSQTD